MLTKEDFMSKLKEARRLELTQSVLMGSILGNYDFGDVPFEAQNAGNLEEALSLANEHGFHLVSDEDSPVIILAKDRVEDKGNKYKVIISNKIEYIEYVWEMVDPYFYYNPRNSLADEAPRHYGEHYPPIPDWVHEFKRMVWGQPMSNVLLDQLR
jgi:hypothetical protein